MNRSVLIFATILFFEPYFFFAQNFSIGHQQTVFVDATRNNRNVSCEIYYPADASGDNVDMAFGSFPVIAFGHGFVMPASVYNPYWEALVPEGYIVVLPTTEGSFFPSHLEFGMDLSFLILSIQEASNQVGSIFFGGVSITSAVMGHSMGGGSAFLAMDENPGITALVAMAPAETNPSAIAAASSISRPSLVLAGLNDCVAPPADHQIPMYDSLSSPCKSYLGIVGGDHCQFASSNFNCTLGQSTCSPQAEISATEQQNLVLVHLLPWLDFYLKDECSQGDIFQNSIESSSAIEPMQNCILSCINEVNSKENSSLNLYPIPIFNELKWKVDERWLGKKFVVSDACGRQVQSGIFTLSNELLNVQSWRNGLYFLKIPGELNIKLIKQ